jgi:DNA-binding transcriptional LysR family regulator
MRRRYPDAEITATYVAHGDTPAALLEHRVDVLVARLPFRTAGLNVTVLYDEPRMLVVPRDHRLAGQESVTLDDIADEVLVRYPDPAKDAFWRIDPRPDGRPAPDGPLVETLADKLEQVAGGLALALAPAGDQHSTLRHDLTTVPIEGIEPCKVVLATRANDRSHLVAAFRDAARTRLAERT